jgi:hypothetical protein
LLDVLLAVRHRFSVISCLRSEDFDPDRLTTDGAQLFERILAFAAATEPAPEPVEGEPDPLLMDLARRLELRGLGVAYRYAAPHGEPIPIAIGHPDLPERKLVAVLTDADFTNDLNVRAQLRLRVNRLERLGWRVIQIWSIAVFIDPEQETRQVVGVVSDEYKRQRS